MPDAPKLIVGLVLFAALVTLPFWFDAGKSAAAPALDLSTAQAQALKKSCVEPTPWMRANHPVLLNQWRNQAVRGGNRVYTATDGQQYPISLQNTCLKCHTGGPNGGQNGRQQQFCDTCHGYTAVQLDCWGCHVQSKEASR
ncbi:MAG TPA: sulfate reduction electron transfer complex DsrMKJOP subunit DsrJ [Symbiobacteriaceae bacterium]|jgi:hypothetical protein